MTDEIQSLHDLGVALGLEMLNKMNEKQFLQLKEIFHEPKIDFLGDPRKYLRIILHGHNQIIE